MPFKLESRLEPFAGDKDFALWLREFETVAAASRWTAAQKPQYLVLFTQGSAKEIARQAADEVEGDNTDAAYTHVVRALGNAFSLTTTEAWHLLTNRTWKEGDTIDGVAAEFRRYLGALGVSGTASADIVLREAILGSLPGQVRAAIRVFEEDGRALPLKDVIVKARTLLKAEAPQKQVVAAAVTSGKFCYKCKRTGHISSECRQNQPEGRARQQRRRNGRGPRCYACQRYGHIARECPQRRGNGREATAEGEANAGAGVSQGFQQARRPEEGPAALELHM